MNGDEVTSYKIDKIPATVIMGNKDYRIRFYGLTAGYEFTSLIEAIMMVSIGKSSLHPELETMVKDIKEQIYLVFTTLTCPYCPKMVHVANQFAFVNDNIHADMVEASEFPHLAQKYSISGVPKTIINEVYSFEGALPEAAVYLEILKAVNPEKFRQLEEEIREAKGILKAKRAEEKHEYEVIIVGGGGPAAMSAAIYSVRKGLDVALIAKKLGGQITYTASVENYLGLSIISGTEMVEQFRNHLEKYPIAETLGTNVLQVKKENSHFIVATDDNQQFKTQSVIYCAGKEYSRLGVSGEELLIGKGIGFCATCDAPLYKGKRVAVVGGGNSAFTAVRDLLDFASEIHLIHRRNEFKADEALIEEIAKAKNVTFHTPMTVNSFLGKDKLVGIRLESIDGKDKLDLNVDGVFLEIGLIPNSGPLNGLVKLNEWGEVPVDKNQSTNID
ncbi:FAD-dependent oxidoreductase, partial [Candidatus Bathyarchaeota archaeon]|nr:FAD-dependent oxidoreductase [Candidatus Bathyarchaeota archaeon]